MTILTQTLSPRMVDVMMTRPQVRYQVAGIFQSLLSDAIHCERIDWQSAIAQVACHSQWSTDFLRQVASSVYLRHSAKHPLSKMADKFNDLLSQFTDDEICGGSEIQICGSSCDC